MLFLLLSITLLLSFSVNGLVCTTRSQCLPVTTNYNYVDCVTGQCVCLTSNGFIGNATSNGKCACVSPYKVAYGDEGTAYCYTITDALAYNAFKTKATYQTAIVKSIYDQLVWPGPRNIMISLITGQPSVVYNYFAENSSGRVDPVGTFASHDGIVEYFYGLTWTGATKITNIYFKKLISQNNIVHSNVVMTFDLYDQAQQSVIFTYNLTQSGSFTFDDNGKVKSVDLIIHNLGQISDPQAPKTPEFINTLCYLTLVVAGCNATYDPTGYYADFPDCISQFSQYQWGSFDNIYFNGNTTICRFFHLLLALGRPANHCPHVGKNGGGKCIPHEYSSYYAHDYKKRSFKGAVVKRSL